MLRLPLPSSAFIVCFRCSEFDDAQRFLTPLEHQCVRIYGMPDRAWNQNRSLIDWSIEDRIMSAQEIIEQLGRLAPDELQRVQAKLQELGGQSRQSLGAALLQFAGTAEGLPADMAENHDHYIHGIPKSGA